MSLSLILSGAVLDEMQIKDFLEINNSTKNYGLVLSHNDVKQILQSRKKDLNNYARVELSTNVAKLFAVKIAKTGYADKENYSEVIARLQTIFYYIKNETEDKIGDNKLIENIVENFVKYAGCIELVSSEMEKFARTFRCKLQEDMDI